MTNSYIIMIILEIAFKDGMSLDMVLNDCVILQHVECWQHPVFSEMIFDEILTWAIVNSHFLETYMFTYSDTLFEKKLCSLIETVVKM